MDRPRIRSQYRVDVLGNIRERLTSLAGIPAFCFEMMQNAEDALSEWIEFRFFEDRIEIANASTFSQEDWDRITEIAHAGKPAENIGTFGVGFTSVFQYTDEPIIRSSGVSVTFSLSRIALNEEDTILSVNDEHPPGTTFVLPWAFEQSVVRQRLEQPTVTPDAIQGFFREAIEALPRGFVFLTHLRRATLLFRRHSLHITVADERLEDGIVLRTVTQIDSASKAQRDARWLVHRYLPERAKYHDSSKRPELSLAFPLSVAQPTDGRLYSFLPTQHKTGLLFHIHGSFFAKSDRKGIERDGESDRVRWNRQLLSEVPPLLALSLRHLVERFGHQAALSVLPPSDFGSDEFPELDGIVPSVVNAVRGGLPLLIDSRSAPALPDELFLRTNLDDEQRCVGESCGARFIHKDFDEHVGWMKRLGIKEFHHKHLPTLPLLHALAEVKRVDDADQAFRSLSFRSSLYALVASLLERDEDDRSLSKTISSLHIAVGPMGTVCPLDSLWRANGLELETFAETFEEDRFWAPDSQAALPLSLVQRLHAFGVDSACDHLRSGDVFQKHFAGDPRRLANLYMCISNWVEAGLSKEQREKLRQAAIWRRADGEHVDVKRLALQSTTFTDPLDLGIVFAHPLNEVSGENSLRVRRCLIALGAEPLSFRTYCLKHIPEYVEACDPESVPDVANRYARVLDVLRSRLRDYQDDTEVVRALQNLPIVKSTEGSFCTAPSLYWPSDVLDTVFGASQYPVPGHVMGAATPAWEEFYKVLGMGTSPRIADVVNRVRVLAKEPQSPQRDEALRHLFVYLDESAENWSPVEIDEVKSLQCVACMPATPDEAGLAQPAACYVSELQSLVGSQGRCVRFFFRPRAALRDALKLKDSVPIPVVVANLRSRVANKQAIPARIYEVLNDHAHDPIIRQLRNEPCVDIGDGRVLRGAQIFFEPVQFGKYRFHLPAQLAVFTDLFRALGVRHAHEIDPEALAEVLRDISDEWSPQNRVPDAETLAVMEHVLVGLAAFNTPAHYDQLVAAVSPMLATKCVPRADGLLVKPSELVFKDHQGFAQEFGTRLGSSLIEKRLDTWHVLHTVFGIPMLSEVVEERLRDPDRSVLNRRAMSALQNKRRFVHRIVESLRTGVPAGWRFKELEGLEVHTAEPLEVEYRLSAVAPMRTAPRATKAFYDETSNRLLLAQGESLHSAAFARAYAQALNPEVELSRTVPLLRLVFEIEDPEALAEELSEMGVDLLGDDQPSACGVQSEEIRSLGTDESDESACEGTAPDSHQTAFDENAQVGSDTRAGVGHGKQAEHGRAPKSAGTGGAEPDNDGNGASGTNDVASAAGHSNTDFEEDSDEDAVDSSDDDEDDPSGRSGVGGWADAASDGRTRHRGGPGGERRQRSSASGAQPSEGSPSSRESEYEAAQNWFRVRVARNRDGQDSEEASRTRSEVADDTHAREAVILFEAERGWHAVLASKLQAGYDIVSTHPTTGERRRIEVKGVNANWADDATVRLSYTQFHDAHDFEGHKEDYWLYVVDRLRGDIPRVTPIRNPARASYWFYLQAQDWADESSDAASCENPSREQGDTLRSARPADIQLIKDCIPDSLHHILEAIGGFEIPVPQFELEARGKVVVVDLAWPSHKFGIVASISAEIIGTAEAMGWTLLAAAGEPIDWPAELQRRLSVREP